jgi:hypothetical protein
MLMGGISGGNYITTPISVAYAEPVPLWIAVAGNSGVGHPTGQLTLLVDGNPATTVGSDYQSPNSLTLNYGERSTVFGNGKTPTSQSSVLPNLVSGLTAGTHQLQATYPGDNSFMGSQTTYSLNITKEDSFFADFFTIGSAVVNAPVTFAGQLGLVNNGCAPYGGTVTATDYSGATAVILGKASATQTYCDSYFVPVTFTSVGQHTIRMSFSGDSNVNASTATYVVNVLANESSSTSLSVDLPSAPPGTAVTLTAQVVSPVKLHSMAGEIVTFFDGSTTLGTAVLGGTPLDLGSSVGLTAQIVVSTFAPGVHNLTAKYVGDTILAPSDSTSSPVTVIISDYTVQAQPATLTVQAGQSGTTTLAIIPIGGSTQTVQLSCGVLPMDFSCNFSPASVTLDGVNPGTVKLTVKTSLAIANAGTGMRVLGAASTLAFAGLLLPFGGWKRRKSVWGLLTILVIAFCAAGCGGGSSNSNVAHQGVYVLNVTASAGTGSAAKAIPLVITVTK